MRTCFQVHPSDNVATLLSDAGAEEVEVLGPVHPLVLRLLEPIRQGHKVALGDIAAGAPIVKYGQRIGHATQTIRLGDWVHLHNCASNYDARSSTLDPLTGAATDTRYE